jgi:hypothetical protein
MSLVERPTGSLDLPLLSQDLEVVLLILLPIRDSDVSSLETFVFVKRLFRSGPGLSIFEGIALDIVILR